MQPKNSCQPVYFFLLGGVVVFGSLIYFGITSINLIFGFDITNIHDLKAPDNGTIVYLQGTVTDVVPLLDEQVYQLQDASGTIWVLTAQTVLQLQEQVLIKGKVRYQSIPLAGTEVGEAYIEEAKLLERIATP